MSVTQDVLRATNVANAADQVPLATQVARILTAARGERPRAQIARLLGVNPNSIREVEVGEQRDKRTGEPVPANLTLNRLEEIADAYGVRLVVIAVPAGQDITVHPTDPGPTLRAVAAPPADRQPPSSPAESGPPLQAPPAAQPTPPPRRPASRTVED